MKATASSHSGYKNRLRRGVRGALILGLIVFLASPTTDAATSHMTDQSIADAVEDELLFDQSVPLNDIDVSVIDNIVTLEGSVNNLMAKERAAGLAGTVKGVRAVVNEIEVEPYWGRMDSAIENDAEEALLYDPATESWEIEVDVQGNKATLTGTVDSWQERRLAEKVVKGVRGITEVVNNIEVDYKTDRTDMEIEEEIKKALHWDKLVDDGLITVKVQGGKVKLSGTVGSAAEKSQARYDAWGAGVESVDASELEVERWARDEDLRKKKYVIKSDQEIQEAIEDALLYDPRVASFEVTPEVSAGMVTLRGQVDNLKAKRAAAQTARNTVGVISVDNRIKVRPSTPTDEQIEENIRDAIVRDPYVERYELSVNVIDGVAYLSGIVDTYFEKVQADDLAARAKGVKKVRNNIVVDYPGYVLVYEPYVYDYYPYDYDWFVYEPVYTFVLDAEIKDEIKDELFWSPFVDSDEVAVQVDDGAATLTGQVDTWSEREAATENAYEGGAVWVYNNLQIR